MEPSLPEGRLPDALQNATQDTLPKDMVFSESHVLTIAVCSVLIVIGATGNITVLSLLRRRGAPRSRINNMLVHLAIADLLVIFLMMPIDIGWACTVSWRAGDFACRIFAFLRIFGLYLSSFILICISVDRYYAVLKPLQLTGGEKRGRLMLSTAWLASAICSTPQMIVFHVESHPNVTWYKQCITFNVFDHYYQELAYSLFSMTMLYGLPLVVFIFCYTSILFEIIKRSRDSLDFKMRRSSLGFLGRARTRTLKMTITIIAVFFICWTPYYVMCLWFWLDRSSAENVDLMVQKGLFLFASTNSCMNPLVYGMYNVRARAQSGSVQSKTTMV